MAQYNLEFFYMHGYPQLLPPETDHRRHLRSKSRCVLITGYVKRTASRTVLLWVLAIRNFFLLLICFVESCDLDYWDSEDPIPRGELLNRVAGLDGLYCLLTEKIDSELLDAAGEEGFLLGSGKWEICLKVKKKKTFTGNNSLVLKNNNCNAQGLQIFTV